MDGMKTKYLKDELSLLYGKSLPSVNREEGNFNVYGSNGLIGHHNCALFRGPSIVVGRKGTVGSVYFSYDDFCAIDTTYVVKLNNKNDDIKYWFYYLKTLGLEKMNTHSAVPGLNRDAVYSKEITVFEDIEERKRVSSFLSSLDNKIELNNRMNKTLEEMAQAIFKSWFVDFEPFQDGEFVDSELGRIPKGWRVGTFSDLVTVKYGKDHKKLANGTIPVYGSGGIMRYADKSLYDSETVLIPRKGSLNNILYVCEPFWSVDTMFYTEMKFSNLSKYIYHFIKGKDLESMNCGSAVPSMTTEILNKLPIIMPALEDLENFECVVSPIYSKMNMLNKENSILSSLRDTLLPKLMSGEIRVPIQEE